MLKKMNISFKRKGFVLMPAILSIFILGMLGVSLASIYSDTFSVLTAGKEASLSGSYAGLESEYLKALGYDEAGTGAHNWGTMEKFLGDDEGKQWESKVEKLRHIDISDDNSVDIYRISTRKKGDTAASYSIEVPLSSQSSGSDNFPIGTILPYVGELKDIPNGWKLCDGNNGTPNLKGRVLQCYDNAYAKGIYLEAGLPNITGYVGKIELSDWNMVSGAFYSGYTGSRQTYNESDSSNDALVHVYMSAALSSAIYGASTTVQPPAYTVYYIIKLK